MSTATQRHDVDLDRRLATAYAEALKLSRDSHGSVAIEAGEDVIEYLKGFATVQRDTTAALCAGLSALWGFPIAPALDHLPADHLAVRSTLVIA